MKSHDFRPEKFHVAEAVVACMRKMLVILNAMARDNQPWSEDYA